MGGGYLPVVESDSEGGMTISVRTIVAAVATASANPAAVVTGITAPIPATVVVAQPSTEVSSPPVSIY